METCALQDKSNPDWTDCSHHLFLCSPWLHSSTSISLCASPTLTAVKLDHYSLLPLSLVSLSRNRTKGGRRSSSLGFELGIWYKICPLLADGVLCARIRVCLYAVWCVWACVCSLMVCVWVYGGPRGAMLAACVTAWKLALLKQQAVSSFKRFLCITLMCVSVEDWRQINMQ